MQMDNRKMKGRSGKAGTRGAGGVSATPLRAGIAGAGLMGSWHARAVKRAGGLVAAVTDLDTAAAGRLAKECGKAEVFSKVERMLDRVELDVLHICTPLSTHYGIARLAIEAGLNVIVEKPLTPEAADAERLFALAADRSVLVCPVHQFIFQDGVRKASRLVPRIGRIVHVSAVICSAGGLGMARDRLDTIVADILPHPLSLMQVFLPGGLPEDGWITARPTPGELRAFSQVPDTTASIFISMDARPTRCALTIAGSNGTLHLDLFHGFAFMEPGTVSKTRKIVHPFDMAVRRMSAATLNLAGRSVRREPAYPGLEQLIGSFYRAVLAREGPPIPASDALVVARTRDNILKDTIKTRGSL